MRIKTILASLLVIMAAAFTSQNAQAAGLRFGIKAGVTVNELKFNEDIFASANRCGFTAGLMTKFTIPVINLGFDASLMLTHRSAQVQEYVIDTNNNISGYDQYNLTSNYIEIPINLRYDLSLPAVGHIITPFLTTGPDFSFLLSKENAVNAWQKKKFDVAWNFGFGVLLVNRLQLHASYGIGLKNAASNGESLYDAKLGDAKNRFWTVTAAYLF